MTKGKRGGRRRTLADCTQLFMLLAYVKIVVANVETVKRFGSGWTVRTDRVMLGEEGLARRLKAATGMAIGVAYVEWREGVW